MIRENSTSMRLFNGDTGLVLRTKSADNEDPLLRVFFAGADGSGGNYRSFATARMPEHDTAYAMTIHKSQGSEFETVVVVLPPEDSPLLSRELLYTAVTRARQKIIVVANEEILAIAVARRAMRQSGLRDALWPASSQVTPLAEMPEAAVHGTEVHGTEVHGTEVPAFEMHETEAPGSKTPGSKKPDAKKATRATAKKKRAVRSGPAPVQGSFDF